MNCKKIKKILSAYTDGEMREHQRGDISNHLERCNECKKEYETLAHQDNYLKQLGLIEPSFNFRKIFWQKVENAEQEILRKKIIWSLPIMKWIPVPVFCSIGIILFLGFLMLSPLLYGISNTETSEKFFCHIKKAFTPFSQQNIFAPLNFSSFCDDYCKILCEECQIKTNTKKCICGRCGDGKI
jgi:hypothetical protein